MVIISRSQEEKLNTMTHLLGVVTFLPLGILLVMIAAPYGTLWMQGCVILSVGTLLMYGFSTIYHWLPAGGPKRFMRTLDHIGIYIMIASSYTPICIAVVGGCLGWTVFAVLWGIALCASVGKIVLLGKFPRLSLAVYLIMGWSVVFVAKPVVEALSLLSLSLLLLEGLAYTTGTWYFSHDDSPVNHAIWHVFVLIGTTLHWAAVLTMLPS